MVQFQHKAIQINAIATALPSTESKHSLNEQTSSDLGFEAALQIIKERGIDVNTIGILLFFSKTADYRGPATAIILQHRLKLSENCLAFDTPIGACGFETALNTASALLTTNDTKFALCVFGDTTSKQLSENDFLQNEIIDASSAMLLEKSNSNHLFTVENLTLSNHWQSYSIPSGGFRKNNLYNYLSNKRAFQLNEHLHIDFTEIEKVFIEKIYKILENKLSRYAVKPIVLVNSWSKNIATATKNLCILNNLRCYFTDNNQYAFSASIPLLLEKNLDTETLESINVLTISFGEGLSMITSEFKIKKSAILKTIATNTFYDNGFVTHEM